MVKISTRQADIMYANLSHEAGHLDSVNGELCIDDLQVLDTSQASSKNIQQIRFRVEATRQAPGGRSPA